MYVLTKAYVKRDRRAGRWLEEDISSTIITVLSVTHGDVWMYITYPGLTEPKALRFSDVANWVTSANATQTVTQWLTSLGNRTLPFADTPPDFNIRYVRYAKAVHAGYRYDSIPRSGQYPSNLSESLKEDLVLTHPENSPEEVVDYCLISVNGLYHRAQATNNGVHVFGANRSLRLANDNQIGIHSFRQIGMIQTIPISESMIGPQLPGAPFQDGVYLNVPANVDISNKTVLVVIGGYLQVLGNTYTRISDRAYRIQMYRLSLPERYYDSRSRIDMSSLEIPQYPSNDALIEPNDLLSDTAIMKLLTLEQSFLVVVDTPSLFQDLIPMEQTRLPGRWIDRNFDQEPIMGPYGRMVEYHATKEDGLVLIHGTRAIRNEYDFRLRPWRDQPTLDDGRYPSLPFKDAVVYKRIIGTEG